MNSISANTVHADVSVPPPPQSLNCDAEMLKDKRKQYVQLRKLKITLIFVARITIVIDAL